MTPAAKLSAFAAILALVFVLGLGLGRAAGPIDIGDAPEHGHTSPDEHEAGR